MTSPHPPSKLSNDLDNFTLHYGLRGHETREAAIRASHGEHPGNAPASCVEFRGNDHAGQVPQRILRLAAHRRGVASRDHRRLAGAGDEAALRGVHLLGPAIADDPAQIGLHLGLDEPLEVLGPDIPVEISQVGDQGIEPDGDVERDLQSVLGQGREPEGALRLLSGELGLARAYALEGNTAQAKIEYQNVLAIWKDADPEIPIVKAAKAEYGKLQ